MLANEPSSDTTQRRRGKVKRKRDYRLPGPGRWAACGYGCASCYWVRRWRTICRFIFWGSQRYPQLSLDYDVPGTTVYARGRDE